MKKIVLLTISFVSILSLFSCDKNYDELIVGEWELDKNAFYELKDGDTCYSEVLKKSDIHFSWSLFNDGNIRIGNVDTNELFKFFGLTHLYMDSILVRNWNHFETDTWIFISDARFKGQIKYSIFQDSICLGTDSIPVFDKFRLAKLNKGKLILEGFDRDNNLRHLEFNKVGFSWILYIYGLICMIILLVCLVGYLIFRIGRMVLYYWREPIYQYGEVYENTDDAEEDTEELLAIKQALKPNAMNFIESERGRNELSSMGDGLWQDIRESRTRYRKLYKSDEDLFIKKDEENDDTSDENMYRLPGGLIPFDGGVIVLPPIYEFIKSKGVHGKFRAWLQSEEGTEWQKSANGIVWVRDVVFNINSYKFTIWGGGGNCGSFWYNIRRILKDEFRSITDWIPIIVLSIISLIVVLLSGEKFTFMECIDFVLFMIIFLITWGVLLFILDYLLGILINFNALKGGERFMKRSTIYYKDFANKVNETNKRDNVYQREK